MIASSQIIGNYRVLRMIGTGGMGAVYLAEHPLIGKRVALKVIHRELAGNREVVQRFFQEARAVNTIGNEHIVEIHDFGQTPEGDHFYMMEYLEGETLAQVLGRETLLDTMRALHLGAQIAHALGAAHAAGVIHRDLKPDNIMLVPKGDAEFVKLLDFGLAKMFAAHSAVKTAAGVLLGTPQYMSPEASESKGAVDHRTDIYALGVLLFQMTTGVLPFDGTTMGEVLVKQVNTLPPVPRGINPAIPPAVEQILLRCLAKAPDARFQSMFALREALLDPEAYLRASPPIQPARSVAPGEVRVDPRVVAAPRSRALDAVAEPRMTGRVLAQPAEPKMNTMRIATPVGYSSAPRRRAWPIVLVLGLLLGLGGGAFAVAWFGRSHDAALAPADAGRAANRPMVVTLVPDAPSAAPTDAPAAPVATAQVAFETVPSGASVHGPDGAVLGTTPLKLAWPIGAAPVRFTLVLDGYRSEREAVVVSQNASVHVELRKLPPGHRAPHAGSGHGSADEADLLRPGD